MSLALQNDHCQPVENKKKIRILSFLYRLTLWVFRWSKNSLKVLKYFEHMSQMINPVKHMFLSLNAWNKWVVSYPFQRTLLCVYLLIFYQQIFSYTSNSQKLPLWHSRLLYAFWTKLTIYHLFQNESDCCWPPNVFLRSYDSSMKNNIFDRDIVEYEYH